MRYSKLFKGVAITLIMFLIGNMSETIKYPDYLNSVKNSALSQAYGNPKPKTTMGNFTEKLCATTEKLKSDIKGSDLNKLKSDVKEAKDQLAGLRKNIDNELSANESVLQKLNAKDAEARQEKFKTEITGKLDSLQASFDKLEAGSDGIKDLTAKVEAINKLLKTEQPQQSLGTLPHNVVNVNPPAPATGAGIAAAYLGNTSAAAASTLPAEPTIEDTQETKEAVFSKGIKDRADSLSTTVNIYEYVKNNVYFEPYYGSRKGAAGTLQQMSGNDYDQASMLIAMLRYKGIPSRYVRGTVEIPIGQVEGWTGADKPEAAVKVLGSLGIPLSSVVSGGSVTAVIMEHVWVEAYIPYENYRGIGAGTGKKIWVPLDPSFKEYTKKEGLDLGQITGVTADSMKDIIDGSGAIRPDAFSVSRLAVKDESQLNTEIKQKIADYLKTNNTQKASFNDLFGGFDIIPQKLGLLPDTLPYKTVNALEESDSINADKSSAVAFSIRGSDSYGLGFYGDPDFSFSATSAELYGEKITLSWIPATSEDEAIINKYGGIFKTPAYLIQLKPALKVDGTIKATGNPVGAGYRQEFTIEIKNPGTSPEKIVNPVTAGSYYCVGMDYGVIAPDELTNIADKLKAIKDKVTEGNIYSDEYMGEMLNLISKTYFGELDIYDKIISLQQNVKNTRMLSEAITGYNAKVSYMFMAPVEISQGGMFIDVDSDTHGVVSLNGTNSSEKTFMQQSGIVGSYMEHSIFEQMFKVPSVSTIKILQEANSSGIPIYTVKKDNISTVLPKLELDESVKTDVSNAVNSGKVVTIPQRNIQYFNWNGTGYIVMDPATGAAGYMISGGLAGGSFSVERFLGKLCQAIVTMAIIAGALMLCSFLAGFIVTPMLYFAVDLLIDAVTEFLTLMFYISFINTVVEFASDPSGEKFEDVLIDALFVGFGLYLNGFGDETSGGKGYIDVLKETFPDFFEKTSDMGIKDEVAAKLIEKSPSESAALEEIETFKDQGLSNERISEICEKLNTEEIDTFKDILNDNPGKYTDTDYAKIQDLLEQCGTKAEMDGLRNDIGKLDEYGIKPSDYESMGINTPERINGVAEALSKLRFKEGYAEHLRNVISFNRDATKGIVGGHNMDEFMNYFRNVEGLTDADFIVSKTPHPTINGIYEITYKVPLKDSAGNILEGQYKVFKNPKTVYDPSVISDAEMLKWGEEAMKNGIINNTINGREITGTASNGLRFKGFIDDSVTDATEITNFFPILQ